LPSQKSTNGAYPTFQNPKARYENTRAREEEGAGVSVCGPRGRRRTRIRKKCGGVREEEDTAAFSNGPSGRRKRDRISRAFARYRCDDAGRRKHRRSGLWGPREEEEPQIPVSARRRQGGGETPPLLSGPREEEGP